MFAVLNRKTRVVCRWLGGLALLLPVLGGCAGAEASGEAGEDDVLAGSGLRLSGNGAPSGPHFNLNIIGTSTKTNQNFDTGGRIFVPLSGSTRILLAEGDFAVLDGNGTDGAAQFQLPAPDPDGDGVANYDVFARALGKPGGSATITTCASDAATGEELCSTESLLLVRSGGRQRFENVSKELLFIEADIDGDGDVETVSLFDDSLQDFLWQFDNNGMRLVQLRFYPIN
jgi:hypothetical protein